MNCLSSLIARNERASKEALAKKSRNYTHLDREPSCCRSAQGLVLHSATLRSTVFFDFDNLAAARDAAKVEEAFVRYKKTNDLRALNRLVDSFF